MIVKENLKNFINKCDEEVKGIVKKIIKYTSFISKKDFFISLNRNISHLLVLCKKINKKEVYIFLDNDKRKSNYWIYRYLRSYIKKTDNKIKIKVITFKNLTKISKKLTANDIVIFTDDCIYSGNQLAAIIGNFIDLSKNNLNNTITLTEKIHLFILVPYISLNGENNIRTMYEYTNDTQKYSLVFNKYKNRNKLRNTDNILSKDEITLMNQYYSKNKNLIESSNGYFDDKHLIIFYYKIADLQSTIPLFYKGLIPNSHNKSIINDSNNSNDYEIIPFISECLHLNSHNINDNCPIPHYKNLKNLKKIEMI
jgi:hypothetical protein